jgi:hypothetical protein
MKKLLIIPLLLIGLFSNAATYYVATTGNDNAAGGITTPWATWNKGFDVADAGDTVFFRGGIYYSSGTNTRPIISPYTYTPYGNSGTYADPICFFAYPGETPILDCSGQYSLSSIVSGISLISCQYIHFKGLTIRNVYQRESDKLAQGITLEYTANLTFENMTVYNISGRGVGGEILVGYYDEATTPVIILSDTTRWINCDFYNLCDTLSANAGNAADGIKITIDGRSSAEYSIPYWYLYGCRVWNYTDDGFDIGGPGIVVHSNCWVSSTDKYYVACGDSIGAIEGNGFKEGGIFTPLLASDTVAGFHWRQQTNCIAVHCQSSGFWDLDYIDYHRTNGLIYNNIAYHNTIGFRGSANVSYKPRNTVYRNNIAYLNTDYPAAIYYTSVYPESNNTWDATQDNSWPGWTSASDMTVSAADFVSLDTTGMWGLRKSDGSLPDISFGKLIEGSDLIDAGVDVGLLYSGSSPDVGYAEYSSGTQIIADHTIVDDYDDIPQQYIDSVKKMWVSYPGESHAMGILKGLELLEVSNATYPVDAKYYTEGGNPDPATSDNLRASTAMWGDYSNATGWIYEIGEEDWWTNATALSRVKANLTYATNNGFDLSAIGFGWCWDATRETNVSSGTDPVTGNYWYGRTEHGPQGDLSWGLDNNDSVATGNGLNITDYLSATQAFIDYCADSIPTKVFFTTGPMDDFEDAISDQSLYQGNLKNQAIRDYVNLDDTRILFDYADILNYDNTGDTTSRTWDGHAFNAICDSNDMYHSTYYAHIGYVGTVRLAKAMWWMLARMAGWDGLGESLSSATNIITFTLTAQTGTATINSTNHTVSIEVEYGTDITDIAPSITLSYGATVIPTSGTETDFTSPVVYTVTAEDNTEQEWTITVSIASAPISIGLNFIKSSNNKYMKSLNGKYLK